MNGLQMPTMSLSAQTGRHGQQKILLGGDEIGYTAWPDPSGKTRLELVNGLGETEVIGLYKSPKRALEAARAELKVRNLV